MEGIWVYEGRFIARKPTTATASAVLDIGQKQH